MYGTKLEQNADLDLEGYFAARLRRARLVCDRFPGGIDFRERSVLDIGCGLGALTAHAIREGARHVTALDPDCESIARAEATLRSVAPDVLDRVSFLHSGLEDLHSGQFDVSVSMAVFEHVPDPARALRSLSARMNGGGRTYLGIGPLYRAPWGDHGLTEAPFSKWFPWSHLVFPEAWLISRRNRRYPARKAQSLSDLGLNGLRLRDYFRAFETAGMSLRWSGINVTENPIVGRLLRLAQSLPGFHDLLAFNLYVVLAKDAKALAPS